MDESLKSVLDKYRESSPEYADQLEAFFRSCEYPVDNPTKKVNTSYKKVNGYQGEICDNAWENLSNQIKKVNKYQEVNE